VSALVWSYIVWGALFWAGAIIEMFAVLKKHLPFTVPWNTLSWTGKNLVLVTNGWFAIALVAALPVLLVHIVASNVFDPSKKAKQ